MRSFSSYLFDFDGTLTQTLPLWYSAISQTLIDTGVRMSDEDIATHFLGGWPTGSADALSHLGIVDALLFSDAVTELARRGNIHEAVLQNGVTSTLARLKEQQKHRALVTNNFVDNVNRALVFHHMQDTFDAVVTREQVTRLKPDPEMVLIALDGRDAGDAVMIGDTAHDVAAARAAGVTAIVYFPAENERYYSYNYIKSFGADHIIRDFGELLLT